MVYGTQITIVFMGFINQLTTGGAHNVPSSYLDSWNFENPGTSGNWSFSGSNC
jgi:hypothetical protein